MSCNTGIILLNISIFLCVLGGCVFSGFCGACGNKFKVAGLGGLYGVFFCGCIALVAVGLLIAGAVIAGGEC